MSNDNDEKKDLTRIENLEEFLHDDDEDFSDLETYNPVDDSSDNSFSDRPTDPNLEFPPEFRTNSEDNSGTFEEQKEESSVFSTYSEDSEPEINEDTPEMSFSEDDPPAFSSMEENFDSEDTFGEETAFDSDDSNAFGNENNFEQDFITGDNQEVPEENPFEEEEELEFNATNIQEEPVTEPVTEIEEEIEEAIPSQKTQLESYSEPTSESPITSSPASAQETIGQLQKFAKNITYGDLTAEGNPPFSIVIKNIKYREDMEDILSLLIELKVIDKDQEKSTKSALERGSMLIPRLSEYAAIIICHKLRRFHLDLLMGLSDEIQGHKTTESSSISKSAVYGDYSHSFELSKSHVRPNDVMTTTTTTLEGHEIVQYLGVVSERTIIDMEHFASDQSLELELLEKLQDSERNKIVRANIKIQNKSAAKSSSVDYMPDPSEDTQQIERVTLGEIYQDLAYKLKAHAITFKGNAVVGINYAVTPIVLSESLGIQSKYQISCTGSVVWAVKK